MNQFDEKYEIRLAAYEDIDMIMQFIDKHWKSGHIMAKDREYFEHEFCINNQVNFVIAIERNTKELEAIVGFLPSSNDASKKDIWGSIWKVNDEHENVPSLGIELERRMDSLANCRYHNGIGINPKTAMPLVRLFLKNKAAKMNHYYMLNDKVENYKLVKTTEIIVLPDVENNGVDLDVLFEINTFDELTRLFDMEKESSLPYKNGWYVKRKFFENPRRKYKIYGIKQKQEKANNKIDAFFVARICEHDGAKAFRIMDYYGDRSKLPNVGRRLYDMMVDNEYEYIDFYNYGFEEEYLLQTGFMKRNGDEVIIPNYYEPFERKNVDIWIHYKEEGTLFFKADGDQDRANY